MMGFAAVAGILIGGASSKRATITHVIIGTFLFQGLLTVSLPVANKIVTEGNLSEILRIIVQNGIMKKIDILKNHTNLIHKRFQRIISNISSTN